MVSQIQLLSRKLLFKISRYLNSFENEQFFHFSFFFLSMYNYEVGQYYKICALSLKAGKSNPCDIKHMQ